MFSTSGSISSLTNGLLDDFEIEPRVIMTVSAVSFNFDNVTSASSASRADEIRVLLVKNRKQKHEGKPPGIGLPGGQTESKEAFLDALKREVRDESGFSVKRVIGKLFTIPKVYIPNEIHLYLADVVDLSSGVREKVEIDASFDPWSLSLRDVFRMPTAQGRDGENRNPSGIYFSHRRRIYQAIETMLVHPEDLEEGSPIIKWLAVDERREALRSAMADLAEEGLLDDFLPSEDTSEEI